MSPSRITLHLMVSVVLLTLGSDLTQAALLAEIGINIPPTFDPSPPQSNSLRYSFTAGGPTGIGEFAHQITASDVGMVFEAPPNTLALIAAALQYPSAGISINLQSWGYARPLDQLQSVGWELPDDRATFHKFVPDITKVPVNRVTMSIDAFVFERMGSNGTTGGAHTIRIYGVPEPSPWVLLFMGSLVGRPFLRI